MTIVSEVLGMFRNLHPEKVLDVTREPEAMTRVEPLRTRQRLRRMKIHAPASHALELGFSRLDQGVRDAAPLPARLHRHPAQVSETAPHVLARDRAHDGPV